MINMEKRHQDQMLVNKKLLGLLLQVDLMELVRKYAINLLNKDLIFVLLQGMNQKLIKNFRKLKLQVAIMFKQNVSLQILQN